MHKNRISETDPKVTVRSNGQLFEGVRTSRASVWTLSEPISADSKVSNIATVPKTVALMTLHDEILAKLLDQFGLKGQERRLFIQRFHSLTEPAQYQLIGELKRRVKG